jgi:hypothetical protein
MKEEKMVVVVVVVVGKRPEREGESEGGKEDENKRVH